MGLIILTFIGALLGWLATIVLRIEDARGVLSNVLAGVAGSLLAGFVVGNGSLFGGLSGWALLCATLGAVAVVAAFNLLRKRAFG